MARRELDFYPTPAWATELALDRLEDLRWLRRGDTVIDPACGDGAILEVCRERGMHTLGAELDPGRAAATRAKGLRCVDGCGLEVLRAGWSAVVMNPPYSHSSEFVRAALEARPARGLVAALLRLTWLEPVRSRADLLAQRPDVWPLPRRPRFVDGRNDNVTSAWFVWPGEGRWSVLAERRDDARI